MSEVEGQASITYFLSILRRRMWGALTVFAVVLTFALIWTFKAQPIYRSIANVEISRNQSGFMDLGEKNSLQTPIVVLLNTQTQVLRARTFMEQVISKIDSTLKDDKLRKALAKEYPELLDKDLLSKLQEEYPGITDPIRRGKLAGMMKEWVVVEPSTKGNFISIRAESKYPEVAALIANMMVETYKDLNRRKKEDQLKEGIAALNAGIEEWHVRLIEARKQLSQYKKDKGIYTISKEDEASLDKATLQLYLDELPMVKKEVSDAEIPYQTYEDNYNKFLSLGEDDDVFLKYLPLEILQSTSKAEYDEIHQKLEVLRQSRGERHPKVRSALTELSLKKRAIAKEFEQFRYNLKREYELAIQKRDDYLKKIESFDLKREAQDETTATLNLLQKKLETATNSTNFLQEQQEELGILKKVEWRKFVSIIDKGYVPSSPSKPNKLLNVFLGLVMAGICGLGMAFFQEHLDNTIKSQEDIEEILEMPLLGTIPIMKQQNNSGAKREIVVISEPKSLAAEAFKTVRTGLFFASRNNDLKTMLITSGGPGEGKTMFSVNLALTIAQSGSRTLLIDADIRKPRVHRILQLDNKYGLTSYLSDSGGVIRTQKCVENENLFVITSGPIKSNPTELLGSPRMKNLIDEARKKFDKIIIDTPPVMTVSDPLILTGISDGIVQVIHFGKSTKNLQLRTKQKIVNFGGRIVGAVLNKVDFEKNGHYYQNYYYSSSP